MEETKNLKRLKEKLIKGLCEYADEQLNASVINVIKTGASAADHICNIIKACEEYDEEDSGYSARSYPMYYYDDGGVERGRATNSYARGRRNAPRDSMGRYSGDGYSMHSGREAAEQIRALMHEAPDEETRREMERLVNKLDR
jgi:hypothetical protein